MRDYLRLFASVVAWQSTGQKVQDLLSQAKEKIWVDPDAAVKEVEELAESLARPEIYRELLRFYEVRNASGATILKRAQRLWDITGETSDSLLWRAVAKAFDPQARWRLGSQDWAPNLDFVKAVWRDAGKKDAEFAIKIADAYNQEDRESLAADVLLEVIKNTDPTVEALSRCIVFLDRAKRGDEADALIQQFKAKLGNDPEFLGVWARHALRRKRNEALSELIQPPVIAQLRSISPLTALQVYFRAGLIEEANAIANVVLRDLSEHRVARATLLDLGEVFHGIDRWDDFELIVDRTYPDEAVAELRERFGTRRRRKQQA